MIAKLIYQTSNLTAFASDLQVVTDQAASLLAQHLDPSHVRLTVRAGRRVASAEWSSPGITRPASFQVSCPVQSKGVQYGSLQVEIDRPSTTPHELILAIETVSILLGLFAAMVTLKDEKSNLKATIRELDSSLTESKLLTRAGGIVAELRGLSIPAAKRWIESEAARTRRSALELADRIVLHRTTFKERSA